MKPVKIKFVKEGEGGNLKEREADDDSESDDADFEAPEAGQSGSSDEDESSDESSDGKESGNSEESETEQQVRKDPLAMQCSVVDGMGFRAYLATVRHRLHGPF